jgi:hypothetical protein
VVKSGSGGYDVTVFVRQKLKGRTQFANANHLEITFLTNNWQKITDTIVFSGATGRKTFHLPFFPVEVMADLDEKISDATTDEFKSIKSTGKYDFKESYCKLLVEKITDSAMVRITHNWVAPDSFTKPGPGIKVSDSRYWTVEGIFPEAFEAKGEFTYKAAVGLDNTLITNPNDSLAILYRSGAGKPWKEVPFTQKGSWWEGTITVDKLKKGEYALCIVDSVYMNKTEK